MIKKHEEELESKYILLMMSEKDEEDGKNSRQWDRIKYVLPTIKKDEEEDS